MDTNDRPTLEDLKRRTRYRAIEIFFKDGLFVFSSIMSVIFHTILILVIFGSIYVIDLVAQILGISNLWVIGALTNLSEIAAVTVFIFAIAVFLTRAIWLYRQIEIEVSADEDSD
jgi:hypothetical protein